MLFSSSVLIAAAACEVWIPVSGGFGTGSDETFLTWHLAATVAVPLLVVAPCAAAGAVKWAAAV
jgi:hypothetical protein